MSEVSLNISLDSELGVYCRIALRVPCLTSFLWLDSSSSSSLTTYGVIAIYVCSSSTTSWVGSCINKAIIIKLRNTKMLKY